MPDAPKFTHLHVHTHFSLLDGATRIGSLVDRVKEQGGDAVAITDHGNMFGVIEFYQKATKAGIKPIIGMEAYMAPGDRRDKEARGMKEASYHLLLMAQNHAGYKNLLKLTSVAYREGFYYKPRIDKEILQAHSEGLICTSTCLGGEIPQALLRDDRRAAEEIAKLYLDLFGEERFFIELQNHGLKEQAVTNPELADIAKRLGIGTVVTNDVHYLEHGDVEAHDVLCCINTGAKVADEDRFKFPTDQFYLKSPAEMRELFKDYPDALATTERVAGMCELEISFDKRYAPVYKVPEDKTDEVYLRELVYEKAREKYGDITDEIRERIDYELSVISGKGFSSYFLIVWDFVNYARSRGIPAGGRGSACSTVVGYCLDLSAPDPLRYGLYFERFMDPDRDEMPDIDIDICQVGREEVIEYVRQKYGHVAQIITFGTLKARAAVKDVGRVIGLGFDEMNKITKLIPEELKMTIDKAMEREPELKKLYDADEQVRKVIDIARRVEGLARHAGGHGAGVAVAAQPWADMLPLYKPPTASSQVITQFDGPCVEECGLLKMDFLGLKTLSVMERARRLAEQNHEVTIDLEHIPLPVQTVSDLFLRGDTKGVFQFESGGMRDVLMKMKPNRIEDLIAANALYRPGPMVYIDSYVSRKHGERWTTPHPIMTEVLDETYGIMVYQEQVSRLVNRLGGIELKKAFRLAKAISKKKTKEIESMREPFIQGAEKNGVSRATAEEIFEDILRFGGYAFNKAHSTGYGLVAYKTAYLKVYYPAEYMAAQLTFEMGSTEKIVDYIDECKRLGIKVSPPDINSSDKDFTVIKTPSGQPQIRFGLGAIKGVGDKAVLAIIRARDEGGPFRSIFDFCERLPTNVVNRAAMEALIKCGAFDSTGAMRKGLMAVLDDAISQAASMAADRRAGQMSLFGGLDDAAGTHEPHVPDLEWTEAEMLSHEKATIGFYVTSHPLAACEETLRKYATAVTTGLKQLKESSEVIIGGVISKIRHVVTKKGRNAGAKMGIVLLEDLHGQVEAVLFPRDLEKFQADLALEEVVFFKGKIDKKREEPSLLVSDMILLSEADRKLGSSVLLTVTCKDKNEEILGQIQDLVRRYPGDKPVYMEFFTENGLKVTLRPNAIRGVDPCEGFCREMRELLSPTGVQVIGAMRAPARAQPIAPPPEEMDDEPIPAEPFESDELIPA